MRGTRVRWGAAVAGLAIAALAPALPAAAGSAAPAGTTAPAAAPALVSGSGKTVSAPAVTSAVKTAGTTGSLGKSGTAAPKLKANAAPGSVIGTDTRVQEYSTTTNPWGSIVHIESTIGGCTGFMFNRDTVVTAGHCVYWNGAWATNYTVSPGRNGVSYKPYGSCTGSSADMWSNTTWTSSYNSDYDYGLIKLTCDVGNSTGWMGWWYSSENLAGQSFYVEGYPGDKPYGTMWWGSGTVSSSTANRIFHTIDTFGGESGSPVYRYRSSSEGLCAGWCVTGIHTTGGSTNGATRFNSSVLSIIQYVANLP
jgi:glutamyl endopeptidase